MISPLPRNKRAKNPNEDESKPSGPKPAANENGAIVAPKPVKTNPPAQDGSATTPPEQPGA